MSDEKNENATVTETPKTSTRRDYSPIKKYIAKRLGGVLSLQKVIENTTPVAGSKDHWFDCYYVFRRLVKSGDYRFVKTADGIGIASVKVIARYKLEDTVKQPRAEKTQVVENEEVAVAAKIKVENTEEVNANIEA